MTERPDWDKQFAETESERNARLRSWRARRSAAVAELVLAARAYLMTNKVYRGKPIGAPGSPARLEQEDKIQAEDALIAAIIAVEEQS